MKLTKLLERLDYEIINGSEDVEITEVVNDSRKACEGSLFICVRELSLTGIPLCRLW